MMPKRKSKLYDMKNLSDEDTEKIFAKRKTNSDKSSASLYIYLVLKRYSNEKHYLTQGQIREYIWRDFEVSLERKCISRYIHNLVNLDIGVYSEPHHGTWMAG